VIKYQFLAIKIKNNFFTAHCIRNREWLILDIKNAYSVKLHLEIANMIIIVYIVLFIYIQINRKQEIIKQKNY
jgi:hypothetical protein